MMASFRNRGLSPIIVGPTLPRRAPFPLPSSPPLHRSCGPQAERAEHGLPAPIVVPPRGEAFQIDQVKADVARRLPGDLDAANDERGTLCLRHKSIGAAYFPLGPPGR